MGEGFILVLLGVYLYDHYSTGSDSRSVIEEKENLIAEILFSSVSRFLCSGKLIGVRSWHNPDLCLGITFLEFFSRRRGERLLVASH